MTVMPAGVLRDWHLVLASASESRLRLLRNAGLDPEVRVSAVDERELEAQLTYQSPKDLAVRLAEAKARDVARGIGKSSGPSNRPQIVIGADSVLDVDGQPQGKPGTSERALERAMAMAGRSADLITGHCLIALSDTGQELAHQSVAEISTVHFGDTSQAELAAYVATGEPLGVAGGFTLDGLSSPFITGISGDPSNVIGLSLPAVKRVLADWGIAWIL